MAICHASGMERRAKMELFEMIRRGHAAGETIRQLAKKHKVHRRSVCQARESAIPPEHKKAEREQPKPGCARSGQHTAWAKPRCASACAGARRRWASIGGR